MSVCRHGYGLRRGLLLGSTTWLLSALLLYARVSHSLLALWHSPHTLLAHNFCAWQPPSLAMCKQEYAAHVVDQYIDSGCPPASESHWKLESLVEHVR